MLTRQVIILNFLKEACFSINAQSARLMISSRYELSLLFIIQLMMPMSTSYFTIESSCEEEEAEHVGGALVLSTNVEEV